MAQFQSMDPTAIGAALRPERDLAPKTSGGGNAAAQLASALGVALETIPQVAKMEGDRAYQEGIDARIADVKRDNANDANTGLFSGLFRKRALDGFDFQDAQLAIPEIALQEQVEMYEALNESTDPGAYKAWAEKADARIKASLEGRSEVYKKTFAEGMIPLREQQARTFANWVVSNREKAKRQAAAAAARASARAAVSAKDSAGLGAYEAIEAGGDLNATFDQFITEAPEKYGISPKDARAIFTLELMGVADARNDPSVLTSVDPRFFNTAGRKDIAELTDKLATQRETYDERARSAAERDAKALEEATKAERNTLTYSLIGEVATGQKSRAEGVNAILANPAFRNDPAAMKSAMEVLESTTSSAVDPALEAAVSYGAKEQMIDSFILGEDTGSVVMDALNEGVYSASGRTELIQFQADLQAAADTKVFADIENWESELKKRLASGNGTDAERFSARIGTGAPPVDPGTAPAAVASFRMAVLEYTRDWLAEDPNRSASRMPRATRLELQQNAFDETLRLYGVSPDEMSMQQMQGQKSGVDNLNSVLGIGN